MIPNLRRVNARYRGPMESHKANQFYEGVFENLERLKQKFSEHETHLQKTRKMALSRQSDTKLVALKPNYLDSFYGLSIVEKKEHLVGRIQLDYVSISRDCITYDPPFDYRPTPQKSFKIEQIANLDKIFGKYTECEINSSLTPIESLIYVDLDLTQHENEVSQHEQY